MTCSTLHVAYNFLQAFLCFPENIFAYLSVFFFFFQIDTCASVLAHPITVQEERNHNSGLFYTDDLATSNNENTTKIQDEKVISVRITSSIAIGRSQKKLNRPIPNGNDSNKQDFFNGVTESDESQLASTMSIIDDIESSSLPTQLVGANIEFIKQLNAKKGSRDHNIDNVHPFDLLSKSQPYKEQDSALSDTPFEYEENIDGIPLARKIPTSHVANNFETNKQNSNSSFHTTQELYPSITEHNDNTMGSDLSEVNDERLSRNMTFSSLFSLNSPHVIENNSTIHERNHNHTEDTIAESSIQSAVEINQNQQPTRDEAVSESDYFQSVSNSVKQNTASLTTVSFNIVHDAPKGAISYENSLKYNNGFDVAREQQTFNLPRIYSEPAKIYSEPAKFYSEPAKIYSEPAKIYSEPAKIYSEPSKIYSEPAKFYSQPASLHLSASVPPNFSTWQHPSQSALLASSDINTTPLSTVGTSLSLSNVQRFDGQQPEKNYEIDEKTSIATNGRSHGVQESTTEKCKQDNCKVGYVVEGRQFKKYRVEERTSDGFIVGEYGVVRNEDGALRGVRYTADSDASPRLIYDALMKFLQLR